MTDGIRVSRVALALGLGLALTACSSMNKTLSKSDNIATKANMQAQVVPIDPSTIDKGPTPSSAERAAVARQAYNRGAVGDSVDDAQQGTGN